MKKILILFLISGSVLTASAQVDSTTTTTSTTTSTTNSTVQPSQHQYYFYPSQNLYYDKASGNYWYKESPSATTWTETTTLPSTMNLENEENYPLHYQGTSPWKNNTADLKKYKARKNGAEKMKTKKDKDK